MKHILAIMLACSALLITSSGSAYERHWNIEMAPPTWDIELFEAEAMDLGRLDNEVNGLLQAIPPILWRPAEAIQTEWASLKNIGDPRVQLAAIQRSNVRASVCDELVDFRALSAGKNLPIRWRDNHRGRSWVDPMTASTLLHALESFREKLPGYILTLGDMAQPGCGQLEYGTLVRHVTDDHSVRAATELLNSARMIRGKPSTQEFTRSGSKRTLLEKTLIGHSFDDQGHLTLRVASRKYTRQRVGPNGIARNQLKRWLQGHGSIKDAETRRVVTTSEQGRSTRLWRHHWIAEDGGSQAIIFSTRRLNIDSLVDPRGETFSETFKPIREMRFSRWDAKKPLSYKSERRWIHRPGTRTSRWETWALVHEAGHQTHISGRDVDISYVTTSNSKHFNASWKAIDSRRTWKWFQILAQAAQDVGGRVERILIGPRIHRILRRRLPNKIKKSAMFRTLLRRVDGHDAHHHLRISPSDHQPLATIPWLWRLDEPLQNLFDAGLSLLRP